MKAKLIDTNIIIRYLVEDREDKQHAKIFELFERIELKAEHIYIDNLVIFESYFVLTSCYSIPANEVIEKLLSIIAFSGIEMESKTLIQSALTRIGEKHIDLVDAYLIELAINKNMQIYSNDKDLENSGIDIIFMR